MKVVVGLGNPGRPYEHTPHNVGFEVVERLARRAGSEWHESRRWKARWARASLAGVETLLVAPLTFMNASGEAVAAVLAARGLSPDHMLVVLDDADLEIGRLRLRPRGGSGGHRGLASVLTALGTEEVARLRIGIGRRPGEEDLVRHVLSPFSEAEWQRMDPVLDRASDAVRCVLKEGLEAAMNRFNPSGPMGPQTTAPRPPAAGGPTEKQLRREDEREESHGFETRGHRGHAESL